MPSLTELPQRWAHSPRAKTNVRSRPMCHLNSRNERTHLRRRTEAFQTCRMVDLSLGDVLTSNQIRTPTTTQMTPQSSASSATAQPARTRSPQPFAAGELKVIQRHGRLRQYRLRCVPRYHGILRAPLGLRL